MLMIIGDDLLKLFSAYKLHKLIPHMFYVTTETENYLKENKYIVN